MEANGWCNLCWYVTNCTQMTPIESKHVYKHVCFQLEIKMDSMDGSCMSTTQSIGVIMAHISSPHYPSVTLSYKGDTSQILSFLRFGEMWIFHSKSKMTIFLEMFCFTIIKRKKIKKTLYGKFTGDFRKKKNDGVFL